MRPWINFRAAKKTLYILNTDFSKRFPGVDAGVPYLNVLTYHRRSIIHYTRICRDFPLTAHKIFTWNNERYSYCKNRLDSLLTELIESMYFISVCRPHVPRDPSRSDYNTQIRFVFRIDPWLCKGFVARQSGMFRVYSWKFTTATTSWIHDKGTQSRVSFKSPEIDRSYVNFEENHFLCQKNEKNEEKLMDFQKLWVFTRLKKKKKIGHTIFTSVFCFYEYKIQLLVMNFYVFS